MLPLLLLLLLLLVVVAVLLCIVGGLHYRQLQLLLQRSAAGCRRAGRRAAPPPAAASARAGAEVDLDGATVEPQRAAEQLHCVRGALHAVILNKTKAFAAPSLVGGQTDGPHWAGLQQRGRRRWQGQERCWQQLRAVDRTSAACTCTPSSYNSLLVTPPPRPPRCTVSTARRFSITSIFF